MDGQRHVGYHGSSCALEEPAAFFAMKVVPMPVFSFARFVRETFTDAAKIAISRERLQEVLGVSLYRNAGYLVLTMPLNVGAGFIFWVVAAWACGEENKGELGLAAAVLSGITLCSLVSTLGLHFALIKFLPGAGERARDMINSCFTVGGLLSVIAAVIFLVGVVGVWFREAAFVRDDPWYFTGFVIFTVAYTVMFLDLHAFVAERRSGFALALGLVFNIVRFVPLVCVPAFLSAFGIVASWGIGVVVAVILGVGLFLPRVRMNYRPIPTVNVGIITDMARYASANHVAESLWTTPGLVLPIMVVGLLGKAANADFYVAWLIATVLCMIPTAIALAMFAEGAYDQDVLRDHVRRSFRLIILLLPVAVFLVFVIGDKVLLVFGEGYSENAASLLRILALSSLPVAINCVYLGVKRVEMRMRDAIGLNAFIAAGTLSLALFFMHYYGMAIDGVGIAWLIIQLAAALFAVRSLAGLWRPLRESSE